MFCSAFQRNDHRSTTLHFFPRKNNTSEYSDRLSAHKLPRQSEKFVTPRSIISRISEKKSMEFQGVSWNECTAGNCTTNQGQTHQNYCMLKTYEINIEIETHCGTLLNHLRMLGWLFMIKHLKTITF